MSTETSTSRPYRALSFSALLVGLAAVAWVASGFVGTSAFALGMTLLSGLAIAVLLSRAAAGLLGRVTADLLDGTRRLSAGAVEDTQFQFAATFRSVEHGAAWIQFRQLPAGEARRRLAHFHPQPFAALRGLHDRQLQRRGDQHAGQHQVEGRCRGFFAGQQEVDDPVSFGCGEIVERAGDLGGVEALQRLHAGQQA